MKRLATGVILAAAVILAGAARGADVSASHDAVAGLKTYLEQPADKRPALDAQPFATVGLTKEDAEAAKMAALHSNSTITKKKAPGTPALFKTISN